jgi:hypothetical protein
MTRMVPPTPVWFSQPVLGRWSARVVLGPDLENSCIPTYAASANVVSLRGGPICG